MTDQAQASPPPLPVHDLIALGTSSQALQQHVTCFANLYDTLPYDELVLDLKGLYTHVVANGRPSIYSRKEAVPMVLLGELKDAPYIGETAKKCSGQSGKQRSGTHVLLYGPGIMFDIDSVPVADIEKTVKALGLAYIVHPSYSSGEESRDKNGKLKAKGRGRLVLFLGSTWSADEHPDICRVIDRNLLGGVADSGAFSRGQGFYIAGLRHSGQAFDCAMSHGQLLSLAKIRSLIPNEPKRRVPAGQRVAATSDALVLEEAREIGALGCVDDEIDWFKMVNAIRRTWPERFEFAVNIADAMSAAATGYVDRADVEAKMKRSDPSGLDTKLDYVRSWAKACAAAIIERSHAAETPNVVTFPGLQNTKPSKVFDGVDLKVHLADGIAPSMEAPGSLGMSPDNVRRAAFYLARWHRPDVIDRLVQRFPALAAHAVEIDQHKAERAAFERSQEIGDREPVVWDYNHPERGVDNIVRGLLRWTTKTGALWTSGNMIWRRSGAPGPEQFEALADLDDHIGLTDAAICEEYVANAGAENEPPIIRHRGIDFLPSMRSDKGPNRVRLNLVMRRLRDRLPKVMTFVNFPTFASLPQNYDDISKYEPHLVTKPGYDATSGLYLLSRNKVAFVPLNPTAEQQQQALRRLWPLIKDFPYATKLSLLAAWFALLLSGIRPSLSVAPLVALLSPHGGQEGGKTLFVMLLFAILTGIDPRPFLMSLQGSMEATDKLAFRKLRKRPEALCYSNVKLASNRAFYSNSISDLVTDGYVTGPLLYSNDPGELLCRPLLAITGNGLALDEDLGSRAVTIEFQRLKTDDKGNVLRIEKDASGNDVGPQKYAIPDLINYVLAHRPEIIADIQTLIMAYWYECQKTGGRPKRVVDTCGSQRSRFGDRGVDFLLDCTTWLLQGRAGSAYDTFATTKKHVPQRSDDRTGVALVEEVVSRMSADRVTLGKPPITKQHPVSPSEIADALRPGSKRNHMGEIMNSRRGGEWAGKTLGDWLRGREGYAGTGTDVLHRKEDKDGRPFYWFAPPK